MSATLPALTLAQASLFLTLCGRALDSRAPRPFLGDPTAAEILARIGYDCSRFPLPRELGHRHRAAGQEAGPADHPARRPRTALSRRGTTVLRYRFPP